MQAYTHAPVMEPLLRRIDQNRPGEHVDDGLGNEVRRGDAKAESSVEPV